MERPHAKIYTYCLTQQRLLSYKTFAKGNVSKYDATMLFPSHRLHSANNTCCCCSRTQRAAMAKIPSIPFFQ
ncbi:hypothetical protein T11_1154 [Trichinella zimbabwensis]|uniref:Uncharacterized protein n=1 Tax=Trichinella zimbabwensis TaxID=268475 RepID=A0A0V1HDT7_9BILA|nr:hypothetical protein T11_1154 [Trichinella zimbabwensis]